MKLIPYWQDLKLKCYFCGTDKSVKYSVMEYDRFVEDEPFEVFCCNKCALIHSADNNDTSP